MSKGPPFNTIFFDCDSTLSTLEGIDDLAEDIGISHKIQELTQSAMDGHVSLEDVYQQRLEMIRPSRDAITRLGERYVKNLVPGAIETIRLLHTLGKDVHIISGGIFQAVEYLGLELGISKENIHAVEIFFDDQGNYSHFDTSHPLSQANGKGIVCMSYANINVSDVVIVGDGVTDLQASEYGIYVVGFGGVQKREAIARSADVFVLNSRLDAVLNELLSAEEQKLIR